MVTIQGVHNIFFDSCDVAILSKFYLLLFIISSIIRLTVDYYKWHSLHCNIFDIVYTVTYLNIGKL